MGLTPLSIINKQCENNQGRLLERIRIHNLDYKTFREELIKVGFNPTHDGAQLIGGVPIIIDDSCVEGPICDWMDDTLQADIDYLMGLLK
jgi:hypothetical protein